MNHKISIVVPVYNAEAFVSRAIDNLLGQEVEKEIILVNDGSKDNSLSILRDYESRYDCIRVIDQPNSGVSVARNAGIDAAIGDFLVFVDSDDLLEEGTLARAISHFADNIDAVVYSYKHVNCNYELIKAIEYLPTGEYSIQEWASDLGRLIQTHLISCIGTKIYRTSILNEHHIRFNTDLSIYEDLIFGFSYLTQTSRLYYINDPLYLYVHLGNGSLFSRNHPDREIAIEENLKSIRGFLKSAYGSEDNDYMRVYEAELRRPEPKLSMGMKVWMDVIYPVLKRIKNLIIK